MLKSKLFLVAIVLLASSVMASAQIKWMSWEEAMTAQATKPKKLLVDVYTDWCGWCKEMDKTTFSDATVAALVSEDFYPVKLNAEQASKLKYNGKVYELEEGGRRPTHALARELLSGRMGYPSIVFMNANSAVIQAVPGYHSAKDFQKIVRYFADDVYLTTPWAEYSGK